MKDIQDHNDSCWAEAENQERRLDEAIHSLEWWKRAKKVDQDLKQLNKELDEPL